MISEFGRRWDDVRITEARALQLSYSGEQVAEAVVIWKLRPKEKPEIPTLLRVPNYFEDLAIIVRCGNLDVELVALALGSIITREWAYWEEAVDKMRDGKPGPYEEFQELAESVQLHAESEARRRQREARRARRRSVFSEEAYRRS